MRKHVTIFATVIWLAAAVSAAAADSVVIMGRWIERLPDGRGVVSEFGPNSLTTYPVDARGAPTGPSQQWTVFYRDVGGDDLVLAYSDGGGNLNIHKKGADAITIEFPGVGSHDLTRLPAK